jgi:hypothetical protein
VTVHGGPAADELVNSVNRNLKLRDTYNKVVENSQKAQRLAAANSLKVSPGKPASDLLSTTPTGIVTAIGKKALNVLGDACSVTRGKSTARWLASPQKQAPLGTRVFNPLWMRWKVAANSVGVS